MSDTMRARKIVKPDEKWKAHLSPAECSPTRQRDSERGVLLAHEPG